MLIDFNFIVNWGIFIIPLVAYSLNPVFSSKRSNKIYQNILYIIYLLFTENKESSLDV